MFSARRTVVALLGLTLTLSAPGCGGAAAGPKRVPVRGTVTLDKTPLATGTVYFKTVATGEIDPLEVRNGEFAGEVSEGERRVEVVAYKMVTVGTGQMKGEMQQNLIPPQYNIESKLTAGVTAAGPNEFKFDLASK